MYNRLHEYFIENELISSSQPGFKPGDPCINQLISTTHDIYQSFDDGFEVRGVLVDIYMAFDKVWHKSFINKLKQYGVAGNLLNTLANFLKNRKQSGQHSAWVNVEAGLPQGIYLNDWSENLVSLFSVIFDKDLSVKNLNDDLNRIKNWAFQWRSSFNTDPNKQAQEILFISTFINFY